MQLLVRVLRGHALYGRILWGIAASACLLMAQSDPPGRVARMSYMSGSVSFRPGDVDDWAPADFNRPLTSGDHIWVDDGGRAELQIGSAALRLGPRTALEFLSLDDSTAQVRVTEGSLNIRLRLLGDQDEVEVDTPNLAFSLVRTGEYRVDVNPDEYATLVTVRAGEGEVTGSNQAFPVRSGEQARVTGADSPTFETLGAPQRDEWDAWCEDRDQRDDRSPSARYVSREMVGYQDLDQYGSWRDTSDYGAVWVPNQTPPGWAPYHYGHWVWVDPWGWTWVDDAPWGFAPFHYGRWAYVGGYWGWVPGPVSVRPVYAPALVAWVGGGALGGGVAWFALGPREVYVPTYRTSPVYLNRVNVTNTTIVNNVNITNVNVTNVRYVNRGAPGAVMAMQQAAFASARPAQSAAIVVRPETFRSAPVIAGAPVAPNRDSVVRMAAPGMRVAQPPAAIQTRPVFARRTPPPPPVSFAQKQNALAGNGGRPLDSNQVQQLRQNQPAPARPFVRPVQAQAPPQAPASPAGQFNRPVQVAPQRAPFEPAPAAPSPAAQAPAAQRPAPVPQRPEDAAPRPFDRGRDRPPQVQPGQPVPQREAAPAPQRQAPPPALPPVPQRDVVPPPQRPAPPPQQREAVPAPQRQAPPPAREDAAPPRRVAPPAPGAPSREAQRPETKPGRPVPKDENRDRKKDDH
jgi:hypothetical protein